MPVKGPIPDLDWLAWDGRRVTLLFDANGATNTSVNLARLSLAAELKRRGAVVFIADLPESDGVNGIDDYLGKHGAPAGNAVIAAAKLYAPKDQLAGLDFTDFGNEQAFELLYRDEFLYNVTAETWLNWGGVCWRPDITGEADRAMLDVAADYFGLDVPAPTLPSTADTAAAITDLGSAPGPQRAILFGAQQLFAQHRGLWALLEARASARGDL